ncbi:hypothetical protein QF025_003038 [Paraburkholderia graminis]|uniref:Uncharacterized protein n=1 Tax=Paraburkholderia graminis TaxID=60548 RepID=A0ABD5CH80_9BURK|nr:hypothetical protein [Paraburkholderia graminis]
MGPPKCDVDVEIAADLYEIDPGEVQPGHHKYLACRGKNLPQ